MKIVTLEYNVKKIFLKWKSRNLSSFGVLQATGYGSEIMRKNAQKQGKHALQTQEESEQQVETRTANFYLLMQLHSHEWSLKLY